MQAAAGWHGLRPPAQPATPGSVLPGLIGRAAGGSGPGQRAGRLLGVGQPGFQPGRRAGAAGSGRRAARAPGAGRRARRAGGPGGAGGPGLAGASGRAPGGRAGRAASGQGRAAGGRRRAIGQSGRAGIGPGQQPAAAGLFGRSGTPPLHRLACQQPHRRIRTRRQRLLTGAPARRCYSITPANTGATLCCAHSIHFLHAPLQVPPLLAPIAHRHLIADVNCSPLMPIVYCQQLILRLLLIIRVYHLRSSRRAPFAGQFVQARFQAGSRAQANLFVCYIYGRWQFSAGSLIIQVRSSSPPAATRTLHYLSPASITVSTYRIACFRPPHSPAHTPGAGSRLAGQRFAAAAGRSRAAGRAGFNYFYYWAGCPGRAIIYITGAGIIGIRWVSGFIAGRFNGFYVQALLHYYFRLFRFSWAGAGRAVYYRFSPPGWGSAGQQRWLGLIIYALRDSLTPGFSGQAAGSSAG